MGMWLTLLSLAEDQRQVKGLDLSLLSRFQRASLNKSSNKFIYNGEKRNNLSDGCSQCLMGKVKAFCSLSNLKVVLGSEGFDNIDIRYLGGYWVMIEFLSEEVKKKFQSNVGIGTWFSQLQQASIDFNIDGRVTWVDLEGLYLIHMVERLPSVFLGKKYQNVMHSEDLFNIYTLLNKKKEDNKKVSSSNDSLKYPLGFTPREDIETNVEQSKQRNTPVKEVGEEIKVFDDMKAGSERISSKEDGNWVTNGKLLLIISVYAPQELTEKKLLWDYLFHVIASWKGEVIIMGDFNEVHNKNERFGSVFNVQGANAFNSFISSAGLVEIFIRSSLLRESKYDYGPIPFGFFQYWLEVDGFEQLVTETWSETPVDMSNAMLNPMKKLKYLKKKIHAWE
ncbi:RNA-directed DNA polymerase, eukaryota [Tanacetum coccineum]